jgi:hypothetical protein
MIETKVSGGVLTNSVYGQVIESHRLEPFSILILCYCSKYLKQKILYKTNYTLAIFRLCFNTFVVSYLQIILCYIRSRNSRFV